MSYDEDDGKFEDEFAISDDEPLDLPEDDLDFGLDEEDPDRDG